MADRPQSRPDRVISTVDTQARHTRKSKSKRRDGFRGHVAAEPETELITDCEMTMAAGDGSTDADNDVKMACRGRFHGGSAAAGSMAAAPRPVPWRQRRDRFHGGSAAAGGEGPAAAPGSGAHPEPGPEPQPEPEPDDAGAQAQADGLEVYGDSAYGSGEGHAAYRAAGHDTIIKPGPLRAAVPGGFTLDDFAIDDHAGTVMAPALERHAGHRHSDTPTRSQTGIQRSTRRNKRLTPKRECVGVSPPPTKCSYGRDAEE